MKRVAITGADGRIGSVLARGLAGCELRRLSPAIDGTDLRDHHRLRRVFEGCEAVIHLAWSRAMGPPRPGVTYLELLPTDGRHTDNLGLSAAVLRAARDSGVRRVILASSVQADNFYEWTGPGLLSPERVPKPVGPYGAAKVIAEEQGRFHASGGLEVIAVRFGAVTADGKPHPTDAWERRVWLSHRDCVEVSRACLEALEVPGRFCVLYAVSDNEGRVHDTANPFGWRALDRATRPVGGATAAWPADDSAEPLVMAAGDVLEGIGGPVGSGPTVSFTRMQDETPEDRALVRRIVGEYNRGFADRLLALLRRLADVPSPHQVSRSIHGLQTATRALRDGADEETVVCALFHDVTDYFSSENHAAAAAELLRPYVTRTNYWVMAVHGEFTHGDRFRFREHPGFERAARFSDRWDQESFDPQYHTLDVDVFEPMVRRIFARTPYAAEA